MVGKLILSHGNLASELLQAAQTIAGKVEHFAALAIPWEEDCHTAEARIRDAIATLDEGDGVLILADMFGDTPCNVARSLLERGRVELVTGINLPLIVRLACASGTPMDVHDLAGWAVEKAQGSVRRVDQPAPGPGASSPGHG
jgi:PTS system mannose-specific IIA component